MPTGIYIRTAEHRAANSKAQAGKQHSEERKRKNSEVHRGDTVALFWAKVDKRGPYECWPWLGCKDEDGYGMFRYNGTQGRAHRYSYILHKGPIPEGFEIDHVWTLGCRSKSCVNPAHLEAVTKAENIRREFAA